MSTKRVKYVSNYHQFPIKSYVVALYQNRLAQVILIDCNNIWFYGEITTFLSFDTKPSFLCFYYGLGNLYIEVFVWWFCVHAVRCQEMYYSPTDHVSDIINYFAFEILSIHIWSQNNLGLRKLLYSSASPCDSGNNYLQ